jgi:hypothetical protein
MLWKLRYDGPASKLAFNVNLRRYTTDELIKAEKLKKKEKEKAKRAARKESGEGESADEKAKRRAARKESGEAESGDARPGRTCSPRQVIPFDR